MAQEGTVGKGWCNIAVHMTHGGQYRNTLCALFCTSIGIVYSSMIPLVMRWTNQQDIGVVRGWLLLELAHSV